MGWTAGRWFITKSKSSLLLLTNLSKNFEAYNRGICCFSYSSNNKIHQDNENKLIDANFLYINKRLFYLSCVLKRLEKKKLQMQKVDVKEVSQFVNIDKLTSKMEEAVEELKTNFIKHLTVRSSTGSMDQIMIAFEGQEYMLQELVQIIYKQKMVVLNADAFPQVIPQILDAINKSGMNVNPQQDGTTIFIPIPKVTKEHRENLAKNAKALYIKSRDKIKDIRSKECKKLKNQPSISIDQVRRVESQLTLFCDDYVKKAEAILDAKQKELIKTTD